MIHGKDFFGEIKIECPPQDLNLVSAKMEFTLDKNGLLTVNFFNSDHFEIFPKYFQINQHSMVFENQIMNLLILDDRENIKDNSVFGKKAHKNSRMEKASAHLSAFLQEYKANQKFSKNSHFSALLKLETVLQDKVKQNDLPVSDCNVLLSQINQNIFGFCQDTRNYLPHWLKTW